jgi:hypothetical protein
MDIMVDQIKKDFIKKLLESDSPNTKASDFYINFIISALNQLNKRLGKFDEIAEKD